MNQDRLVRTNELSDLLWNEDADSWYPEDTWSARLADACRNDVSLIAEVCEFARISQAADPEFKMELLLPLEGHETPMPEMIGGHKIVSLIGNGGMGIVYEALFHGPGMEPMRVALKVVKEGSDTEKIVRRLRAETNLLSRLDHPNVIKILNAGSTESGDPFFTMELVDGGVPIDQYCSDHELSLADRITLFLKLCGVLEHVHKCNIVHRDLKPANILITRAGEPKILDFGLATFVERVDNAPSFVNSEETPRRLGTPGFMSPQQARGELPSLLHDVFALGANLRILVQDSNDPSTENRKLAAAVKDVVANCCKEEPSERIQSATALSFALRQSLSLASPGFPGRVMAFAKTRRGIAVAALGLLLAIGFAVPAYNAKRRDNQYRKTNLELVRQRLDYHEASVHRTTQVLEQYWMAMLKPVTKREGSFEQQVKYTRRLVDAGDITGKGMLALTFAFCRDTTLLIQREQQKRTRADRYPTRLVAGLRRSGIKLSQEELDGVIDDEINVEERAVANVLSQCSAENVLDGVEWLKELALKGQSVDAALVARILMTGMQGVEKNQWRAFDWATRAAQGGHPEGHALLGELYNEGVAVPKNLELAIDHWEIAAQYGNLLSQYKLAYCLRYGLSKKRPINKVEAYKWALIAASNDQGLITGMHDPLNFVSAENREVAKTLSDKLGAELPADLRHRASALATAWRPLPIAAQTMKYDIAEHEAIRKAVLGDEPTAK